MQLCRDMHGIRVDVEGENPLIVKERLCSQVLMQRCFSHVRG